MRFLEVKRSLESPAPNGAPGAVCGRWRRGRRRLRRRWRVRPQQGGPGVSWCVPSVCGSACIAHCICSARRSPSSSCARFCAPGRTHRPPAAHQAPAFFARAAAAVRGFALHAGAAGPPPSAYQTRPAKRLHRVPAFRPVFARSPRAVQSMPYTRAPAISPFLSCARPGMQAHSSKQEQEQPILGCFAARVGTGLRLQLPSPTDVQH